jgi:hypothetical protein
MILVSFTFPVSHRIHERALAKFDRHCSVGHFHDESGGGQAGSTANNRLKLSKNSPKIANNATVEAKLGMLVRLPENPVPPNQPTRSRPMHWSRRASVDAWF